MTVFHHEHEIGPLEDIQINLAGTMGTHINTVFQGNFLTQFVSGMVHKGAKSSTHHVKALTQSLFQKVLARGAAANIARTNNKNILHQSLK